MREIVEREVEKYDATLSRGTKIVQKVARTYKAKRERLPLKEIITLYDSHGIPPDMTRDIAVAEGAVVDLPDNFYSLIADMHSESRDEPGQDPFARFKDRISGLPVTRKLYYEQPCSMEFDAMVIDFFRRVCGPGPDPLLPGRRRTACRYRDADRGREHGQGR